MGFNVIFPAAVALFCTAVAAAEGISVDPEANLERLLAEEDTDGDRTVTIEDTFVRGAARGDDSFELQTLDGTRLPVRGTYRLGNLVQDLARAGADGQISPERLFADPVERTRTSIGDIYWDELTRRIDADNLASALPDDKIPDAAVRYLYVPHDDARAWSYFHSLAAERPDLDVEVHRLPQDLTPEHLEEIRGRHGLLSLALEEVDGRLQGVPFVVPGGRFNEMYGWDSYFITLGLLADGRLDLARGMVDNLVYQVRHYGKVLNANRSYYLTRSQPPLLLQTALATWEHLPGTTADRAWLAEALRAAAAEYRDWWMADHHFVADLGLNRYFGTGTGLPPEVEPGAYAADLRRHARDCDLAVEQLLEAYEADRLSQLGGCDGTRIAAALDEFFMHDRCARESGHDTTYRWRRHWHGRDRCADFVTVDLNSLLYRLERDMAKTLAAVFDGRLEGAGSAEEWRAAADRRRTAMLDYLWDREAGAFFDYDTRRGDRHSYTSATGLYPLWADAGEGRLVDTTMLERMIDSTLRPLLQPGGLAASTEQARGPISDLRPGRQWDFPHGWAPHQILVWHGLGAHGRPQLAAELAYRWLYALTRNAADYNGTIPEKLDVARRAIDVSVEYGNVGTRFEYKTPGFGWTNASYQLGFSELTEKARTALRNVIAPEWQRHR